MNEEPKDILSLINNLVSSDVGFESDCVELDIANGIEVSEREKQLASLVSHIYRIVHPVFSSCQHTDWEQQTNEDIKELKEHE